MQLLFEGLQQLHQIGAESRGLGVGPYLQGREQGGSGRRTYGSEQVSHNTLFLLHITYPVPLLLHPPVRISKGHAFLLHDEIEQHRSTFAQAGMATY